MSEIIQYLAGIIIAAITAGGYWAIVGLMAIESANIPLPSEVIMPFSGYLVAKGSLNIWMVALAGAFGCVVGSALSYWLGKVGGRPFIERYGKYILISKKDLDRADRWFGKFGEPAIFFSRLLPVIRTFISFPAGITRMNFSKFIVYTFIGSFPWTLGLAYFGFRLGERWDDLKNTFHGFDVVIGVIILVGIVLYVYRHVREVRRG